MSIKLQQRSQAKVSGAARYTADIGRHGALSGAILRSPLPHAQIARIDVEAARRAPGVHAVLTGIDLPEALAGRSLSDIPLLCREVVRFIGDRVAAVAAETREQAETALQLIDVTYDELPAVFSPADALAADAPVLHPEFLTYRGAPPQAYWHPNVCAHEVLTRGDVDGAFAQADIVLEHAYSTSPQYQGYLEPHAALVEWSEAGDVLRVWASHKAPFLLRDELARILGVAPDRIVVEPVVVGGDFGGKASVMEVPLAAHLSRIAGRPVLIVEGMSVANPRHASRVTVRTGLCRDGRLVARSVRVEFDGGAYAGYKPMPGVNLAGRYWSVGPYRVPNVRFESTITYSNNPPAGHMRAPGEAQLIFATEVDMDRCAHAVGLDPLQFRQLNVVSDGESGPLGEEWQGIGLQRCLSEVRGRSAWLQPRSAGVGRGISVSHCAGGMGASEARVELDSCGRATLYTAAADQGSGSHAVLVEIVARSLQLPSADINIVVGSTDEVPFDSGSSASRVTYVAGSAVHRAAEEVRHALVDLASELLGCSACEVSLVDGVLQSHAQPRSGLTIAEVARRGIHEGQPLVGKARFADFQLADTPSFAALVVELEVDRETGAFAVRRLNGAFDVGTVLNETGMDGQIRGGIIQGLGFAQMEEVFVDTGHLETTSLADYKLPTSMDVPPFEYTLITDLPGRGPFGAKSIGELANPLVPAAIANAIHDAIGVWITELPLSSEKIYLAVHDRLSVTMDRGA